jgi:alkylation response protein AidB-like acyl-CoA dehydrogenase
LFSLIDENLALRAKGELGIKLPVDAAGSGLGAGAAVRWMRRFARNDGDPNVW